MTSKKGNNPNLFPVVYAEKAKKPLKICYAHTPVLSLTYGGGDAIYHKMISTTMS